MSFALLPRWAPLGAILAAGGLGCSTGEATRLSFPWNETEGASDASADEATFGPLEPDGVDAEASDDAAGETMDPGGETMDPGGESDAGDGTQLPAPVCDVGAQDCPGGEKCTIWANDGGDVPNDVRCVPLTGTAQPGDSCVIEGIAAAGVNDCDAGSYCLVDGTTVYPVGVCRPFCQGTFGMAECENPDSACGWFFNGMAPLCLPQCNAEPQDCPAGQSCIEQVIGPAVCFGEPG